MITNNKKELIKRYFKIFKEYMDTEEYDRDVVDRQKREEFFRNILNKEKIEQFTEFEIGEIISNLWATSLWTNKEYLVRKLIQQNGIDKLRKSLIDLLYGKEEFERRFDKFMKEIKGLGPASVTEILCFFNPKEYGIWNDKARKALKILGFSDILPLNKYYISGKEYKKFNNILKAIGSELQNLGLKDVDLLLVDYFLYIVWKSSRELASAPVAEEVVEFDHDEIRDHVRDIGALLGFDADIEVTIAPGSRVDVVWRAKIGNLGTIEYVFEIHKKGSIKSLILNLQKASRSPTVQKVIAVSNARELEKIRREVEGLPEDFLKKLVLWDVNEVERVYEQLTDVALIIRKLGLISS